MMKFLGVAFFFFGVTKVKAAFSSVLMSCLSVNIRPKACAGMHIQSSFHVSGSPPTAVNHRMYTHATHKESILAHKQLKAAGHCGLLPSGNWQPFFSCKQQPDVTPCSGDSGPTLEILSWQNS